LTDFSFSARDKDGPVANRVEPGKRPRSAMSPTIVFEKDTGKLVLAVGSPGGPAIINYVAKTLVGTLDWGLNMQQAIALARVPMDVQVGDTVHVEIRDKKLAASVVKLPFVRNGKVLAA